jgi:DNA excision repair protein ERCC-2
MAQQYPEQNRKLIYCSRTVPEIDKALAELKHLINYRKKEGLDENFFGVGLTSRKNLCLHPVVSKEKKSRGVDSKCRNLTASWVRARAGKLKPQGEDPMEVDQQADQPVDLCDFYEVCLCLF